MVKLFAEAVQGVNCNNVDFRIRCKDGSIKWGEISCRSIYNTKGINIGHRSSIRDITNRKHAEDALLASIKEKEILIREVHHRAKNNMQVMLGLFDLQASTNKNPELTEILKDGRSRIRAMALIHETLYDSKDFTKIDLTGYVTKLSRELFQVYKVNPHEIELIIQTEGAVHIDISKATSCGLILNELISNALKYAFTGDKPGKLEIIMHDTGNAEIEILIRDNGPGIPDDIDIHQTNSVGLYLVNGLVTKQLDGHVEIVRGIGTEFRIIFPSLTTEKGR
jgi:two-component sensor histidine kinase